MHQLKSIAKFATLVLLAMVTMSDSAMAAFPGDNGKLVYTAFDPTFEIEVEQVCTRNPNGTSRSCFSILSTSQPAWSPSGTRLAVSDTSGIYTTDSDGSHRTQLTSTGDEEWFDYMPAWSPDGNSIAFATDRDGNFEIYVMNADGTDQTRITTNAARDWWPSWSADGAWIGFTSNRDGNEEIYKMRPDGTDVTRLTTAAGAQDSQPDWSPDAAWITFQSDRFGSFDIYKMRTDGTDVGRLTNNTSPAEGPVWSPDGTKIAFTSDGGRSVSTVGFDGFHESVLFTTAFDEIAYGLDWQPLLRGYPRPRGATPTRVPLVPAQKQCTSPNSTHGAPLSFPSCSPPQTETSATFLGIGDGNPAPARSIGSVALRAIDGSATPGDDSDVQIRVQLTNVMRPDGSEYPGELRLELPLRITDRFNRPHPNVVGPGTVADTSFHATVPCSSTPDPVTGSTCALTSTADAILPATVREGARSIWGLGQIKLHDGGTDGDAETAGDNQLLAVQGVFIP